MYKVGYDQVSAMNVEEAGAKGVTIRVVISEREGADNFVMRVFTVEPGGHTPLHTHKWEHEVFILKGGGAVVENGEDVPIKAGDVIFVPGEEEHQFKNVGNEEMQFICLIPVMKVASC